MKKFLFGAVALLGLPLAAHAQEEEADAGSYVLAIGGQSRYDLHREPFDAATLGTLTELGLASTPLDSSLDRSDVAFGASLGYRFSRFVGIEAGYLTLGKATYRATSTVSAVGVAGTAPASMRAELAVRGATLGLAAFVPVGRGFDVHARGGVFFAQSKLDTLLVIDDVEGPDDGTGHSRDGWYGYGVGYRLSDRLHLTVDYTHFRNVGDQSETIERTISLLGAGLLYRF